MKKIVISYNTTQYVVLFRSNLIMELIKDGFDVYVISPFDEYVARLLSLGCTHVDVKMASGINLLLDIKYFIDIYLALRRIQPKYYLGYTIKPNIFGNLACRLLGIKTINNVTGLGSIFINKSWTTKFVIFLYRIAFGNAYKVFFQNPDDQEYFLKLHVTTLNNSETLPGSGIDLEKYKPEAGINFDNCSEFVFLFIGRVTKEKGVQEFLEAARIVKIKFPNASFWVIGSLDHTNPSKIDEQYFQDFVNSGVVDYHGFVDDVRPFIISATCVCLPSYREGTPRSLLEGAALGKPLIATDVPGCRQVVKEGDNGFLALPQSSSSLAMAMEKMLSLSDKTRISFGMRSRILVETLYDEKIVINAYKRALGF